MVIMLFVMKREMQGVRVILIPFLQMIVQGANNIETPEDPPGTIS